MVSNVAPNVAYPKTDASALELLTPEGWVALDGYEWPQYNSKSLAHHKLSYDFAYNEVVNVMECVPLETLSTATGRKNYIAVATTVNRGEDLAAKGAVSLAHCIALGIVSHILLDLCV